MNLSKHIRMHLLLAFLVAISTCASAQVLNMSHDLVPLGIASQNLVPDVSTLDARPLMQAAIQYVSSHPVKTLTLDKGNYYLLSNQQANATLIFARLSNMTVDLAGSNIYFKGPLLPNGIQVFQCTNFTLANFQTDFLTPPYTHVQLASVDAAQRVLNYQTIAGWPDPSTFNNLTAPFGVSIEGLWAVVFRNGGIVPGITRTRIDGPIVAGKLALTQDGTPWTQANALAQLRAGDTVVVTARGGGPPILVWESDSVTLSNVAIYGSPTWAVQLYATSNSTVDGVRVMPRPNSGLVGSNADGIHFLSARQNNHIRNSHVTRTLDDALIMDNMHVALIVSQTGPRNLRVSRHQYLRFANGTPVNFVDPVTTLEIAGAVIVAQDPPDAGAPTLDGQVDVTFDRDLPTLTAGMGMVFGEPAMRGQGSTIENNVAEDTYGGRGVWLSGVRGVSVQNNVIRRTSLAGIIVSQSTDPLDINDLGPPAHDIQIRGNTLEGALGPAANGTGAQTGLASIQVVSTDNRQFGFSSELSNTNIAIAGNSIVESGRSAIWIGELNGGTVQDNSIGDSNRHPELGATGVPPPFIAQVAQDFSTPIVVRYSSGVTSANNHQAETETVVEYYNASLDHYFITRISYEIAALDEGTVFKGWERTGQTFRTYATARPGTSPVCRYYIPPGFGDSHFFGRGTIECDATGANNPNFKLEDPAAMHMFLPVASACPAKTTEVYRVYSHRADVNHRYMIDKTIRDYMVAKGWQAEGEGPNIVVMCAPQ